MRLGSIDASIARTRGGLFGAFDDLAADLKFAARLLRRERVAATAIVACLAIGIGATTAAFSVANALLLEAMPYPNGDRVVSITTVRGGAVGSGATSLPDFNDWRERSRAFSSMSAFNTGFVTVVDDDPARVPSVLV